MLRTLVTVLALASAVMGAQKPKTKEPRVKITVDHKPDDCPVRSRQNDMLAMHYIGKFKDGSVFDNSYDRNMPLEFTLGTGMVIKGWDEGLKDMCVGEKRTLFIPYQMAYGEGGFAGRIPPKADLTFEVELVDVIGRRDPKQYEYKDDPKHDEL
ncbi:hypothetical protein A1Q1_07695 [Trichosporon asahii var. asahii CBS 2479]|uniref:peptidylprolyl isomerase n=1 Tax=Trichosporon asahii var. asahii (strain ATCC 90039 / CBS 2479 / JCM 2466 / KCTC 7840 / NBRC 103889/ NCYC 2677 / UAMH 7654) TaxID=1186058 RepID=J4UHM9_TRIAS|nr:hypothetical protein A1Q1_07695 [Trichosporon asahii var. asahii CBS 2479]EJT51100.1 hypothetical protein A1Q1_07695 [Trichosporon asahii var. asahii CBS 2479]